ncbi:MAG TPA: UxaA family hydrolase, partial [Rhizomicrobium sp.]|nr:UxaA family hydrolase [Rhizomicrobium sp.]
MNIHPVSDQTPRRIQIDPRDNVAVVVNALGLPAGTIFPDGLILNQFVPQGHKVALAEIAEGGDIVRYGQAIGTAVGAIRRGDWIDETKIAIRPAPALEDLAYAQTSRSVPEPLAGYTFEGFRNPDGTVGTKNILAISTSVQCVAGTMEYAVKRIKAELLPRYPNVDDVVVLTHAYGCGVAINAPMAVVPIRTLQSLARNPNFGGEVMVVGLGCEKLAPERLLPPDLSQKEGQTGTLRLQDEAFIGFGAMVDGILAMAEERLKRLNARRRETVPASALVVGMQCGGSDAFTGITANPALGVCADLLVRAGATVLFSEVTEVRDAIHLLLPRAADEQVAKALLREMAWYDNYLELGGADRAANTTPGNKKGGLANIIEKSLGSVAKSGTSTISGVLAPGERATHKG